MPSNFLILCRPFLLPPQIFPSTKVFSNESVLHIRWPKYWSFSFSISPSKEYSGLISFRMDWLDLLAVQGTLKSLLQHHGSKVSILWRSAFFTVQLSYPYRTTGKIIALTRQTFVDKVMYLLFNMLSMLVIAFLPRSKHLLISWLQSLVSVILEPPKIKSVEKINSTGIWVLEWFFWVDVYKLRKEWMENYSAEDTEKAECGSSNLFLIHSSWLNLTEGPSEWNSHNQSQDMGHNLN